MTFKDHTAYINHFGRPYVENSSDIEVASPPRYIVCLFLLISQTFNNVKAITKLSINVSVVILQK